MESFGYRKTESLLEYCKNTKIVYNNNMHRYRQRQEHAGPSEADDVRSRLKVPKVLQDVEEVLAGTLEDWWKAAKDDGQDVEALDERIGEINRSLSLPGMKALTVLKVYIEELRAETDAFRFHAAETAERGLPEREREREAWERERDDRRVIDMRDETGKKIRRCMAHRAGRTHRTAPKIVTKW